MPCGQRYGGDKRRVLMMVIEETQVPDAALPLAALKRQLRMGSGFEEDGLQEDVLLSFLRAALAAIEARTGKALLTRSFLWTHHGWRDAEAAVLPLAPVVAVSRLTLVDRYGVAQDGPRASDTRISDRRADRPVAGFRGWVQKVPAPAGYRPASHCRRTRDRAAGSALPRKRAAPCGRACRAWRPRGGRRPASPRRPHACRPARRRAR